MTDAENLLRPASRADTPQPLTMADLEFLPDLDALDRDGLEALLARLEALSDALDDEEPDEGSEAHDEWEESLFEVAEFIDAVQSLIEDMEDGEEA